MGPTAFALGVAHAMSNWFGVGGARHRRENYEGYAEGAQSPAIRRWVFAKVGPFDEGEFKPWRNIPPVFIIRVLEAAANAQAP